MQRLIQGLNTSLGRNLPRRCEAPTAPKCVSVLAGYARIDEVGGTLQRRLDVYSVA